MMPEEFVRDFAKRTLYNCESLKNGPYEVTQLINSCIGLLIVPKERSLIEESKISKATAQKLKNCVKNNTYNEELTVTNLIRHMRNGISHAKFEFKAKNLPQNDDFLQIESIVIRDKNAKTHEQISITIPIDVLRSLCYEIAEAIAK